MNTLKNISSRIVGEALAVLWGTVRWLEARPRRRCEACDEWHRPDENHPVPPDPEERRIGLLQCMNFLPDFGREILACLRDEPEFAEFVTRNIAAPDPHRASTPEGAFSRYMRRLPQGPMPLKNERPAIEKPPILKRLERRIEGEIRAFGWGLQRWWKDRPILYCTECERWDGCQHEHDSPPDPEETRRDLLLNMRFDPEFSQDVMRCLRREPEFAAYVAKNIGWPDSAGDNPAR